MRKGRKDRLLPVWAAAVINMPGETLESTVKHTLPRVTPQEGSYLMSSPTNHELSPAPALGRGFSLMAFLVCCIEVIWASVARKELWVRNAGAGV